METDLYFEGRSDDSAVIWLYWWFVSELAAADLHRDIDIYLVFTVLQFKRQNKDYEKTKTRIMEIANYVDKVRLRAFLLFCFSQKS